MTQIVELKGTEKRLYQLVAPLVMNPEVLKQNYNYPFRTSEIGRNKYGLVYNNTDNPIAEISDDGGYIDEKENVVNGLLGVEWGLPWVKGLKLRAKGSYRYYIKDNNAEVLKALLEKAIASIDEDKQLSSVTFIEHQNIFQELGFSVEKTWRRYVKMNKEK